MPPPIKPYIVIGKVQYRGVDISGSMIWITNESISGLKSFISNETDSNFAYNIANVSSWTNGNRILISATHNGRRGQKRITVNSTNFGEDIGIIQLKSHWGMIG